MEPDSMRMPIYEDMGQDSDGLLQMILSGGDTPGVTAKAGGYSLDSYWAGMSARARFDPRNKDFSSAVLLGNLFGTGGSRTQILFLTAQQKADMIRSKNVSQIEKNKADGKVGTGGEK